MARPRGVGAGGPGSSAQLLVTQGGQRVHAGGAVGGDQAGDQGHAEDQGGGADARRHVEGRHPDDELAEGPAGTNGTRDSQKRTCQALAQPVAEDQAQDGAPHRAQGHAHAELVGALGDQAGHHTVDSDQGQHQGQRAEDGQQPGKQPRS